MAENSQRSASKRGKGKPFAKGRSGNPGGRPKESDDVKALARQHTVAAITRLVYWMGTDNPKASVSASVALLDRAWGKAPQALTGEDGKPLIPPGTSFAFVLQQIPGAENQT